MDVPAAAGGERGAKVTPFDLSSDDRDRTSDSSFLTAAVHKQPSHLTDNARPQKDRQHQDDER